MRPEPATASRRGPDDADRGIVAEGLVRDFGELRAVDGVDLRVPSGQIFGFLGPNGAGKSTVVKMLTTILRPTAGRATVAGLDVGAQQGRVRRAIGVALQEVGLDPLMTARESLVLQAQLFGASSGEARGIAERLLVTVGLDDVDPAKRIGGYSGGMKRRLDLALALAHDPLVLFLDEPTTGLDPASRMAIWDEVRRLNDERGMTIFLTTQYLEEADRLADDIAIIDHGRIVAKGSPAELKRDLGDEVVELTFEDDAAAARAASVLGDVAPQCSREAGGLRCYFSQAAGEVPQIVRALDLAGLPLRGLTVSQPTLDDVFLRATGETMAADDPDDEPHDLDEAGRASKRDPATTPEVTS
jgi:ABC-2 type transport system ATP-binding protein